MKFTLTFLLLFISFQAMSTVTVVMETSMGNIEVELDEDKAPITVENYLNYVDTDFFAGTLFHRTIRDFVIQGGGVLPDMTEKPTNGPIKNEARNGMSNLRGTIGMARDTAIDTATSQFFINTVDNLFLNHRSKQPDGFGYCVFGQVCDGLDVVDQIRAVKTGNKNGHGDVPLEPVFIKTARLVEP